MNLQTEFEFTLPRGYVDEQGNLHKRGVMRLATAVDVRRNKRRVPVARGDIPEVATRPAGCFGIALITQPHLKRLVAVRVTTAVALVRPDEYLVGVVDQAPTLDSATSIKPHRSSPAILRAIHGIGMLAIERVIVPLHARLRPGLNGVDDLA